MNTTIVFSAYVQLYVMINYMNLNLYSKWSDIYVFSDVISVELWSPNLQSHLCLLENFPDSERIAAKFCSSKENNFL